MLNVENPIKCKTLLSNSVNISTTVLRNRKHLKFDVINTTIGVVH